MTTPARDEAPAKLRVENVVKVFGRNVGPAMALHEAGTAKEEILAATGCAVGVAGVSFAVRAGEVFVVMGLSGSGKSTLVRCVNRLIEPTAGAILIDGEDVTRADAARLRQVRLTRVAMVFQHFALFPHRTVAENTAYGLKVRGAGAEERRARALECLDLVGLKAWADRYPDNLSGGMRQRVGLARALAVDPEILLMDEPFGALDPLIRADMQAELVRLQTRLNKTIVFITHDLDEALRLGDQVAIMKDGRFVQVGTPEAIVARPADPYVAAFTRGVDRGRVLTAGSAMRPAEALDAGRDDAGIAAERMRRLGRQGLHVTDARGRAVGLVLARDLGANPRAGGDLGTLMRTSFPTARADDRLAGTFAACREGLPLAVVADDGRLLGALEPLDVLARLVGSEEAAPPAFTPAAVAARA